MNEYSNKNFLSSPNHIRRGRKGEVGRNKFRNISVQLSPATESLQLLSFLLAQSSGVEEHPEDDDLTEENDGHEVATAVQADGYFALKLKYSFGLLCGLLDVLYLYRVNVTSGRNFSGLPA